MTFSPFEKSITLRWLYIPTTLVHVFATSSLMHFLMSLYNWDDNKKEKLETGRWRMRDSRNVTFAQQTQKCRADK